jgi:hypothetical protein
VLRHIGSNLNSVRCRTARSKIAEAVTPRPASRRGSNEASLKKLVRGGIPRGQRYRQQSRWRIEVSQRRLILIVGLVANLARIIAGFTVALVLAMTAGGRSRCLLAVGRAPVQADGRSQYRDGQESIHPAANHSYRHNLADYLIGSIRGGRICKKPDTRLFLRTPGSFEWKQRRAHNCYRDSVRRFLKRKT